MQPHHHTLMYFNWPFNNCNFSQHEYVLPDVGVTAPKHVGAVLIPILM